MIGFMLFFLPILGARSAWWGWPAGLSAALSRAPRSAAACGGRSPALCFACWRFRSTVRSPTRCAAIRSRRPGRPIALFPTRPPSRRRRSESEPQSARSARASISFPLQSARRMMEMARLCEGWRHETERIFENRGTRPGNQYPSLDCGRCGGLESARRPEKRLQRLGSRRGGGAIRLESGDRNPRYSDRTQSVSG